MWKTSSLLAAAVLALYTPLAGRANAVVTPDPRDPFFERRSTLKVGAKGEDVIDVGTGAGCSRFHHAEIVWIDRRFADAQFVQIPQQACIECEPLIVRWYHEPTGKLHFQVKVYRTSCAASSPGRPGPAIDRLQPQPGTEATKPSGQPPA